MNNMSINKDLVRKKIELIQTDLGHLEKYADLDFDEIAKDYTSLNVVERVLEKIIGRGIDINQHIISQNISIKVAAPLQYRETFLKLGELDILPNKFALEIAKSAGFRNILVHEYNNIDEQMLYQTVGEAIFQYTRYCDYILGYLEKIE